MKNGEEHNYRCPATGGPLRLDVLDVQGAHVTNGVLVSQSGHRFVIEKGIPDFTWPEDLPTADREARQTYEGLADEYDKYADIPFETCGVRSDDVRDRMVDQLCIAGSSKVLEIGCGDGRGSEFIAKRLNQDGKFYLQDLSPAFLNKAVQRLSAHDVDLEFSVANASYLPFPNDVFDAAHHFGGLNNFSNLGRCLRELVRVTKPSGKVVVGDESMAPWLRETDFGKIMMNSNPLLRCQIPFDLLPVEVRDVRVEWIMLGAFYTIELTVGEGPPVANYHVEIPSQRGGNHWTRYHGNLEGVTEETKRLADRAREKSGDSMHKWLDRVVCGAAKKELGE